MQDKFITDELSIIEKDTGRLVCMALAVFGQYENQVAEMQRICDLLNGKVTS